MRASLHRRRAVEKETRRAAIAVIIAVIILAIIGFIAHLLRQKGWLGRGRRERH
jgi:SecE/Sec61-gamma subunits of protein translocation complex